MKDSSQEQKHRHSDTQVKFMSSQPMDKKASLVTPQFENVILEPQEAIKHSEREAEKTVILI